MLVFEHVTNILKRRNEVSASKILKPYQNLYYVHA